MGLSEATKARLGVITALVVTGFGIGWLAGLSVSPVVSIVITSVTGVAAAVVTALSGLKEDPADPKVKERRRLPQIEVWPLAILLVGMLIGSTLGILARNNHFFGSDVTSEIQKWAAADVPKEAVIDRLFGATALYSPYTQPYTRTLQLEITRWTSLGIPKEQVVNRMFEQYFATKPSPSTTAAVPPRLDERLGTYLFASTATECVSLLAAMKMASAMNDDELLIKALRNSTITQLQTLPDLVADPEILKLLVEQVLCADS
jgi:hypothetical protein